MAYLLHRPRPNSLGDEAAISEISEADYRRRMVASQEEVARWQRKWVEDDRRARMLQLAATLSIPLAGVAWKWLLGRRASI